MDNIIAIKSIQKNHHEKYQPVRIFAYQVRRTIFSKIMLCVGFIILLVSYPLIFLRNNYYWGLIFLFLGMIVLIISEVEYEWRKRKYLTQKGFKFTVLWKSWEQSEEVQFARFKIMFNDYQTYNMETLKFLSTKTKDKISFLRAKPQLFINSKLTYFFGLLLSVIITLIIKFFSGVDLLQILLSIFMTTLSIILFWNYHFLKVFDNREGKILQLSKFLEDIDSIIFERLQNGDNLLTK